jgi:hypothetical protein
MRLIRGIAYSLSLIWLCAGSAAWPGPGPASAGQPLRSPRAEAPLGPGGGSTSLVDAPLWISPPGTPCPTARAVLDTFPAPGDAPMGLDWVETRGALYHVDEMMGEVYSITPEGAATYLFRVGPEIGYPVAEGIGNGICHVETARGEYLYLTDYRGHQADTTDMVYQFELDGTLVASWDVEAVAEGVVGICFDGDSFWLQSDATMEIVRCDTAFQEIQRFLHPMPNANSAGGLDYDPETDRYYVCERSLGIVSVCDSDMTVVDAFALHPTASRMVGVSIGRATRGRTLWSSSFGPVETHVDTSIYEIEDLYYNETKVRRSTWGSIKAMFR